MTKHAVNISLDSPSLETIMELENRAQMLCSTSNDLTEGAQAFFEKRDPKYPLK
jgi:enoyl-CoA hydratase/carnithine racemase